MMKKILLALVLVMAAFLCSAANVALGDTYNPIVVTSASAPKSISGPQKVTVTISVSNNADDAAIPAIPVTLYDPAGNQVSFSGGVTQVGYQQKATYTGDWSVTADELNAGQIKFKLSYSVYDTDLQALVGASKVVSVGISKTKASAKVTGAYTISPSTATKGQKVTLTYTVSNVGNTDVIEVQVTNVNLSKNDKVTFGRIKAGEQVTKTYEYEMGSKTVKSRPKVTYKADGNKNVETVYMKEESIQFRKGDITVNLKAKPETEVKPGTKVDLICTITNTSNVGFEKLKITDPILGDIATNISLAAKGKKGDVHVETKTVEVSETGDYTFHVVSEAEGEELDRPSNTVRLVAIDMSKQLQLSVSSEVQSMEINEKPAELVFVLTVKNTGEVPGKDLVLKHGNTTIAKIPALAPGEEQVLAKKLLVSMEGKFKFTISGANEQGTMQSFDSNELQVAFVEPTPLPTVAPTAEPPPENEDATPIPAPTASAENTGTGGIGMTLLYVMAGLLVLALAAVIAMVFIGRRRGANDSNAEELVLDSMQRGTRREYAAQHRMAHTQSKRQPTDELDVDGLDYPGYEDAPEELSLSGNASIRELAAVYGRPNEQAGDEMDWGDQEDVGKEIAGDDATSEYLARMRGQTIRATRAKKAAAEAPEQVGQYRLTRKQHATPAQKNPDEWVEPQQAAEGEAYKRRRRTRGAELDV